MNFKALIGKHIITPEQIGRRLDVALAALLPGLSLRETRRLWLECLVELNNKPSRKGMIVHAGDVVTVHPMRMGSADDAVGGSASTNPAVPVPAFPEHISDDFPIDLSQLRILKHHNNILAIFKPAGLHSACLPGGKGGMSLEKILPELCISMRIKPESVSMFNRLDCLTSGIVLACSSKEALTFCLNAEAAEQMEKRYLALVCGQPQGGFTVKYKLDTDSRAKTKVLNKESNDPLRHTKVEPLYCGKAGEFGLDSHTFQHCALVQVTIRRGARHQIRAHLAAYGYPIWGDPIYNPHFAESRTLYLHHFAVSLPGFLCIAAPMWPGPVCQIVKGLLPGIYNKHQPVCHMPSG